MREFSSLSFPKKGSDIIEKSRHRLAENIKKIDEKKTSAQELTEKYKIDVLKLLMEEGSMRGYSNAAMPSDEMSKLQSLAHRVDELQRDNKTLKLIIENLPERTEFNLTFDELTYFGF